MVVATVAEIRTSAVAAATTGAIVAIAAVGGGRR